MYYVVQKNTFNEKGHERLIQTLERFKLPHEIVDVLPFLDDIEFKTKRKDVFCFGALKMAKLYKQYGWDPGVLMTKNHDFLVYRNFYQDELLNFDSVIQEFGEDIRWRHPQYFIRPCKDTKVFAGSIFNMIEWGRFKTQATDCRWSINLTDDVLIQVSPLKRIQKEYRFWIVDGKVITGSLYKMGHRACFSNQVEESALIYCQKMVQKYELSKAFVMDVCLVDGKYKIVECGCINCAGFYEADMQKIITALEDVF